MAGETSALALGLEPSGTRTRPALVAGVGTSGAVSLPYWCCCMAAGSPSVRDRPGLEPQAVSARQCSWNRTSCSSGGFGNTACKMKWHPH